MYKKELRKSRRDKMLFGVCGGIAERFGWDSTLIRIGFVIGAFFAGSAILFYFLLALIMPD
mgnify:CR=1